MELSLGWVLEQADLDDANQAFVRDVVTKVQQNLKQLDGEIQKYAPAWPVEQLSLVDRNILRMAIYEMQVAKDAPVKVIINEAVELARTFGSEGSQRFVNGVLGTLAKAAPGPAEEKDETP